MYSVPSYTNVYDGFVGEFIVKDGYPSILIPLPLMVIGCNDALCLDFTTAK